MPTLEQRINDIRAVVKAGQYRVESATADLRKAEESLQSIVDKSRVLISAREFLEATAKQKEENFKKRLETMVQYGLDSVFGPGKYNFIVKIGTFQGKRSIEIGFTDNPSDPNDEDAFTEIVDSHGGSVVVVVSYFLQVALLLFSKSRPIIIADEKFLMLDEANSSLLPEIISHVSKKLGVQTILVTHEIPLAESCEVCYRLEKTNDGAKIASKRGNENGV